MIAPYDAAAALQTKLEIPHIERIVIAAPNYLRSEIITLLSNDVIRERIPDRLRGNDLFIALLISSDCSCELVRSDGSIMQTPEGFSDSFRENGLRNIFHSHDVLLDGRGRFHFRKPSNAHSSQFIRISAALSEPAETDFIAIWLIKYLSPTYGAFLCDTAAITSIPYATLTFARRFLINLPVSFEVGTFHSFRFVNDSNATVRHDALYIISVTTAAHLEKLMIKKGVRAEQMITLYGVSDECTAPVLCFLHTGRSPISRIINYHLDNCPECFAGTPLVNIVDDDFLAIVTHVDRIIPSAADAPRWLNQFMKEAKGLGVVRCYYGQGPLDNVHDVYLDVRRLLASEGWKDLFDRHLSQAVPSSLGIIYYVDEYGAEEMAAAAQQHFYQKTGKEVPVKRISQHSIRECPGEGTVFVIDSITAGGRQILAASQLLRDVRPHGEVVFFVGLLRSPTVDEARRLRSNLTFTPDRRFRFVLHVIEEIEFPDNTRTRPSLWANEVKLLKRLILADVEIPEHAKAVIDSRIRCIERAISPNERGLSDGAFYNSVDDEPLKLRPNFSLFDFSYANVTQSEVFFTVSSLLHNLRVGGRKPRLVQSPFRRALIDPQAFTRFNDGIVQAALLRAALPVELDYSIDLEASAEVASILDNLLINCEEPSGEATNEFIYALFAGNLKIAGIHLKPVLARHIERRPSDRLDVLLAKQVVARIE